MPPSPADLERAELLLRLEREADRVRRWDMIRTGAECVGWCVLSLYLLGSAFHTTDVELGKIFFLSGILVGNGGIVFSLARAYLRGEERGDW